MAKISARGDEELARFRALDDTCEIVITRSGRILRKSFWDAASWKLIGRTGPSGATSQVERYEASDQYRRVL